MIKQVKESAESSKCVVCGESLPAAGLVHCGGRSRAFNSQLRGEHHHTRYRHPPCIVCGADMGCVRCSGAITDLLCVAECGSGRDYRHDAAHWASKEALAEHGQLLLSPEDRREAMTFLRSAVARIAK